MRNKTAAEVMTRDVVTVKADIVLVQAMQMLLTHNISGLPVVDENDKLIGIITEHDIMNFAFSGNADNTIVREAMITDVISYTADTDLATLINCCMARRIRRVPIVADGKVVGIVSRRDILRCMLEMYNQY